MSSVGKTADSGSICRVGGRLFLAGMNSKEKLHHHR